MYEQFRFPIHLDKDCLHPEMKRDRIEQKARQIERGGEPEHISSIIDRVLAEAYQRFEEEERRQQEDNDELHRL